MPTLSSAISASASALNAERARIEVAVSNLANAESTRGPDGQPYRRRDVVLQADPGSSFDATLGQVQAVGVKVADIVQDGGSFRTRYEPNHPDADENGFVQLHGKVEYIEQSEACSYIAARIKGVKELANHLHIAETGDAADA